MPELNVVHKESKVQQVKHYVKENPIKSALITLVIAVILYQLWKNRSTIVSKVRGVASPSTNLTTNLTSPSPFDQGFRVNTVRLGPY